MTLDNQTIVEDLTVHLMSIIRYQEKDSEIVPQKTDEQSHLVIHKHPEIHYTTQTTPLSNQPSSTQSP